MEGRDPAITPQRRTNHGFYTVVRAARRTCRWCAEPTAGSWACRHCTDHHRIPGTSGVVVPLTYAIAGTEWSRTLRDYKDHPSQRRRTACAAAMTMLLGSALPVHQRCVASAAGMPIDVQTTIPSLTWRPGAHPFTAVVRGAGLAVRGLLAAAAGATCHRTVDPTKFVVLDVDAVTSRHVLILDDIWTTGSNAQSAALALHAAGASSVSIMVVGRWLNPGYPPTKAFIDRHPTPGADLGFCPVTGDPCSTG